MLESPAEKYVNLRAFVDKSLVEIYANDRVCLTAWVRPPHASADAVALSVDAGAGRLVELDVWQMESIW
jgi:beta-fructofuranosidase